MRYSQVSSLESFLLYGAFDIIVANNDKKEFVVLRVTLPIIEPIINGEVEWGFSGLDQVLSNRRAATPLNPEIGREVVERFIEAHVPSEATPRCLIGREVLWTYAYNEELRITE